MEVRSKRALPQYSLRPRSKEAVTKVKMYKKQIFKDRYCSDMAKIARQQLALIQKCRMNKGGKGVANQPFYVQFLNR